MQVGAHVAPSNAPFIPAVRATCLIREVHGLTADCRGRREIKERRIDEVIVFEPGAQVYEFPNLQSQQRLEMPVELLERHCFFVPVGVHTTSKSSGFSRSATDLYMEAIQMEIA
jgi:hypothetical protein